MTWQRWARITVTVGLGTILGTTMPAEGRGGGGRGGGGFGGGARGGYSGGGGYAGGARPAYSGNGSVRYAPRSSAPTYSRPAAPSYARPAAPSYSRPGAPVAAQRPAYGSPAVRPAIPSHLTSGGATATPVSATRPPNYGSINRSGGGGANYGTITTPGGSTIGGIRGPGGGGAVGIQGSGGGAAGAVRGPGGSTAGGVRGPAGGAAGAVVGPGGGGAAGVRGAGGLRGAGAVWGPGGGIVAGARGPYAGFVTARLPDGAVHYPWRGYDYWHAGFAWYSPCWIGDDVHYAWTYPPIGYYYPELPPEHTTIEVNENTYYYAEGVYYQEGEKDEQEGYVVAEVPEGYDSAQQEDPFQMLKDMCDCLAGLEKMNVTVSTTADDVLVSGEKTQTSARRTVYVSRPDRIAAYVNGDSGEKRLVYNGKTVSLYDRQKGAYTVIDVPGSIDAALDTLASDYGIVMPLDDLLYKDAFARLTARVKAGQYLGTSKIDGADCHHLAFTTDAVDWEVWVEAGEKPLPRRITIDHKQQPGHPRYSGTLAWGDASRLTPGTFEFVPPGGVRRIQMPPVRATTTVPATQPSLPTAGKETP